MLSLTYKSIGYKKLEIAFQLRDWGLPFKLSVNYGAFSVNILCIEILWWRKGMNWDDY